MMGNQRSDDTAGYEIFGRIEGTVTIDGERFGMSAERSNGSRDHHWGTRDGVGGPGHSRSGGGHPSGGQWVEFEDWSVCAYRDLYNLGDPRHEAGTFRWNPGASLQSNNRQFLLRPESGASGNCRPRGSSHLSIASPNQLHGPPPTGRSRKPRSGILLRK